MKQAMTDTARFGDILTRERDEVSLSQTDSYATAGILSYGRGLFKRPVILGSQTSYKHYYRLSVGQFVYSKLFAWEGALAVVDTEFDGYFVSQEFPTFSINQRLALPAFVRLLCQWPTLWESVRQGQTGMGGRRKRVHPDFLLTIAVPLPDLQVQHQVVSLISTLDNCIAAAREVHLAASAIARSLREAHFTGKRRTLVRVGDFFEITMGRQRSPKYASGDHMVPYLRSANVKDGRLDLIDVKEMNFTPAEQRKYALQDGDVLVSEGCGSLEQLGAAAQWLGSGETVCFQNTLLRVRARSGVSTAGYAYQWARFAFESNAFASVASGTNIFHIGAERAAEMLVAPIAISEQDAFVAAAESADRTASLAANELEALDRLRLALLEELLPGTHVWPEDVIELVEDAG
jgi:type I restriction enzyme, S subunit